MTAGQRPSAAQPDTTALVGDLALTLAALAAGFGLGGWFTFETAHWRAFRTVVQAGGDGVLYLSLVVVALAFVARVGLRHVDLDEL